MCENHCFLNANVPGLAILLQPRCFLVDKFSRARILKVCLMNTKDLNTCKVKITLRTFTSTRNKMANMFLLLPFASHLRYLHKSRCYARPHPYAI